jgi:hypothetical protein
MDLVPREKGERKRPRREREADNPLMVRLAAMHRVAMRTRRAATKRPGAPATQA